MQHELDMINTVLARLTDELLAAHEVRNIRLVEALAERIAFITELKSNLIKGH